MKTRRTAGVVAGALIFGQASLCLGGGIAQADSPHSVSVAVGAAAGLLPQGGPPNTPVPPAPSPESAPAGLAPPPPPPPGSGIPDRRCGSDLFTGAPLPC